MRKKTDGKNPVLVDGPNVDLVVERVLNKLLEFSAGSTDSKLAEIAIRDAVPELKSARLKETVAVPGYTPIFIFEWDEPPRNETEQEVTLKETGHEQREQREAFEAIQNFLYSHEEPVTIKVGNKIYRDIWDVQWVPEKINRKTTGETIMPIADFVFRTKSGERIGWLSHKGGTRPEDFRQYTGVGAEFRGNVNSHPEFIAFKEVYSRWLEQNGIWSRGVKILPYKTVAAKVINSVDLRQMAMFGQYTHGSQRGLEAVDFLIQGKIRFKPVDKNTWELIAHEVVPYDADLENMPMPYVPVLTVRYANDRANEGFPYSRVTIYPYQGAHGEKDPRRAAEIKMKYI
jgi:hypothetical protein